MMDQFKYFVINEQKFYLGQRAGDILTVIQNLENDASNMGNRALIRAIQGVANQIRRILRGRWDESDIQYLKRLQKVGVALLKGIDEKEDIEQLIVSCSAEIQSLLNDLEVPINSLGSQEEPDDTEDEQPLQQGMEFEA